MANNKRLLLISDGQFISHMIVALITLINPSSDNCIAGNGYTAIKRASNCNNAMLGGVLEKTYIS